jgi:hypothetical protein
MEGGGSSLIVMACRSMTRCEAAKQQILKEIGVASNIVATNSSTSTRTTVLTIATQFAKERFHPKVCHQVACGFQIGCAIITVGCK